MKISTIQHINNYNNYSRQIKKQGVSKSLECADAQLPQGYYYPTNINFGLANAEGLRKLFSYGLPCIYTGVEMIDPQKVIALTKMGLNRLTSKEVLKMIEPYYNSVVGKEKEVLDIVIAQAQNEPNKTLQETLQILQTQYEYELLQKQIPIFKTLTAYSYSLPENIRYQFNQLMNETNNRIERNPIVSDFSVTEFKYKLERIKDDIGKLHDKKALQVMNNLLKSCDKFAPKTSQKNINDQKKVLSTMDTFLKRSVLRNNVALSDLFKTSKAKLNLERVKVDFSRKSFIHDLSKILKPVEDKELRQTFLKIATKLPTSQDSVAAYITKLAKEPSYMIVYRLLWPTTPSVEHLLPHFCGGEDKMSNYGGACSVVNSDRQHKDFTEQMKRCPDTPKYCQKYIDRLIKYAEMGIFEREGIDIKYIEDFKNTIYTLSKGQIVLDTSRLYKIDRFRNLEPAE